MRALLLAALLLAPLTAGCFSGAPDESLQRGVEPPDDAPPAAPAGWAAPGDAAIRPGMLIRTEKRDCLSNFVFTRPDNTSVFVGATANCFRDMPVGTLVTLGDDGAERIGLLVYNSWQTMSEHAEEDPEALEYNDFAVVRVDSSARDDVSPALLQRGGPVAPAPSAATSEGARVLAFADGAPTDELAWRPGVVTGRVGTWALLVHSPLPALPGHMGGAVVNEKGEALGVAVSLGVVPNPGALAVARLDALMRYAAEHARLEMVLATAPLEGSSAR